MGEDRIIRRNCSMATWNLLPALLIVLLYSTGVLADGNVTMESLTIYNTHEWFGLKPTVYFRCHEESKVYLPDVVHKNQDYFFIGQESWQPLTTLHGEKCKRCGLYEEDTVKADDIFYEAELCPSDFTASPTGQLVLFKEKEFNASLLCPDCGVIAGAALGPATQDSEEAEDKDDDDKGAGLAFGIIVLVLVVLFALGVVAYTKWRQKQRRDQQARFVKMFEDDDEFDTELGLKEDDL